MAKKMSEGWTTACVRVETLHLLRKYRDDVEELQEYHLEPLMRPNGKPGGGPPGIDAVICRLLLLVHRHRQRAARQRGAESEEARELREQIERLNGLAGGGE